MKYCKNCGNALKDDATFCTECGNAVGVDQNAISNNIDIYDNHGVKTRNIAMAIVLTIITCGLYGIYWMVKINNESLKLAEEKGPSGIVVILLTIITCGIYSFIWWYKMGVCTDKISSKSSNSPLIYIVLALCNLGIVNYALAQNAINDRVSE